MRKIEHQSNTNNILITNIQRFSIRDGPGIRTTVVGNDTVLGIGDFSNQTINFLQNNQGRSVMGLSDVIKNVAVSVGCRFSFMGGFGRGQESRKPDDAMPAALC